MADLPEKLSLEQAKQALLRSGYLLESRLDTILRRRGYYIETNAAYPDPETGKSRELDLYAMCAYKAGPAELDYIFAVLLIECVNNSQPVAFVTKEPQTGFLHPYEVKLAGLPAKMPRGRSRRFEDKLPEYLGMDKYHHYCKGRIATQFCSFAKKKGSPGEWMAFHDDIHFDSFRKVCVAVEHFLDRHFKSWKFGRRQRENVNIEFYYPVVVVQGDLLDVRSGKKSLNLVGANHIQHRRSVFGGTQAAEYQIDVVTERFFPRYLTIIDQEMSKAARLLRRRNPSVREAIDKIARNARRFRSPEKIRAAMEW